MKLNRPKYNDFQPGVFPGPESGFDVCELKFDGWWGQLLLDGHQWTLFSRTGQIKASGETRARWERTLIHGEYCVGTQWARQHPMYYGRLVAHDIETAHGTDIGILPNSDRRALLCKLLPMLWEETVVGGIYATEQWQLVQAADVWAHNPDFEGLVFKSSKGEWGAPWGRMKREVEMDYVCCGFEPAKTGKFVGKGVASVRGGLFVDGGQVPDVRCLVSGLTDEQRVSFYNDPEPFVGRVFTASGKAITAKGALRHPAFVRWRDDKSLEECVWSDNQPKEQA